MIRTGTGAHSTPCSSQDLQARGRAVGVEANDKSDFLVNGAVIGPVDAFDSELGLDGIKRTGKNR
jgi:hypothetical protein